MASVRSVLCRCVAHLDLHAASLISSAIGTRRSPSWFVLLGLIPAIFSNVVYVTWLVGVCLRESLKILFIVLFCR